MPEELILIDFKLYKKCTIISLPALRSRIYCEDDGSLTYKKKPVRSDGIGQPQHLYILSDGEIEEGDWVYSKSSENCIIQVAKIEYDSVILDTNGHRHIFSAKCKIKTVIRKIIATTDPKLKQNIKTVNDYYCLPSLTENFLSLYCSQGGINEVLVQYELCDWNKFTETFWNVKVKVSPENKINIKIQEINYNKDMDKVLEISGEDARKFYTSASEEMKKVFETTFGKEFFFQKITDRIQNFRDVLKELGKEDLYVPKFLPDESSCEQKSLHALSLLFDIVKAYNEGWAPDWDDTDEYKWTIQCLRHNHTWIIRVEDPKYSSASIPRKLVFKSKELAEDSVKKFERIYRDFFMVK